MSVSTRTTCVTEGGDSSAVQDQLFDVHHIQATESAFAAIRGDGVVVLLGQSTRWWRLHRCPGETHRCEACFRQRPKSLLLRFRADKTVVTWGSGSCDLDGHIPVTQLLFPIFPNSSGFVGKKGVGVFSGSRNGAFPSPALSSPFQPHVYPEMVATAAKCKTS